MRLIDADELIENFLNHCRTEFEIKNCCMANENVIAIIQNAPTVEPTFREVVAYECGQKSVERSTEVNCSHCDYFKFSKSIIENVVKAMTDCNIETVEDLMKVLNHINEWFRR